MPWYNMDYAGNATMLFKRALLLLEHTFEAIFNYVNSNVFAFFMVCILCWLVFGFVCYLIRNTKK